jgi:selenocysteine-specific elongation factor
MRVLATAGHVDHGKSALVRALTGMEPDRWEEERRRGLTLDLGFVWTTFDGVGRIAFVDVPGHERFVPTMLAGVGPVPGVVFVVAADQGWQQQSSEHLEILDALGVRHAVLAVTRADLADPEPVRAGALERMAGTSLGKVPSVAVSAVTSSGLDELREEIHKLANALPVPDAGADVRLWLDRVFTVRGHGTVVTGTLAAGTLRTGDRLLTGDGGAALRVRGLQALNEPREEVRGVARVAVNVQGTGAGSLRRGDVLLAPDRWLPTGTVDVRLSGATAACLSGDAAVRVSGETAPGLPRHVTLHIGTAAVPATVRPLGEDTARLTLTRELPLRVGDRAVLREPGGRRRTRAVTVLDVRPPGLTRRGAARKRAAELAAMTGRPDGEDELRRRRMVRRPDLLAMGVRPPAGPVAGDWLADPGHWRRLRERLATEVERHAARHPMDPGLPTEAARRLLDLPERLLVDALAETRTPGCPPLTRKEGRLYGPGRTGPTLPPPLRAAVDAVRHDLERAPFRAPEAGRLTELGLGRKELAAAVAAGELLRIADGLVLLPGADTRAAAELALLDQPFTLSEARKTLDTTRRVAVPLLELLDAQGRTERVDDRRRRCRSRPRGGWGTGESQDVPEEGNGGGQESNLPARDPRAPRF